MSFQDVDFNGFLNSKSISRNVMCHSSSGVFHSFRNTGSGMLKLFTTYSPPEHEPGTEHATKAEADADD